MKNSVFLKSSTYIYKTGISLLIINMLTQIYLYLSSLKISTSLYIPTLFSYVCITQRLPIITHPFLNRTVNFFLNPFQFECKIYFVMDSNHIIYETVVPLYDAGTNVIHFVSVEKLQSITK